MSKIWTIHHISWLSNINVVQSNVLHQCAPPSLRKKYGAHRIVINFRQICSLSPHSATPQYCGQPNRLQSCGLKKSCGTAITDLQNLTSTISQLSAVSCQFHHFPAAFPQLRMVLKFNCGGPAISLQHSNTQSHWSSSSTACFPSRGSAVCVPGMHKLTMERVSPDRVVLLHWWPQRDSSLASP